MHKSDSVTPLHIILLLMTASGLKNHVFAISPLISTAGRDAWMTVLITMVLILLWAPVLIYIHKKTNGRSIMEWLSKTIGIIGTRIFMVIIICYLLLSASVSLRETITWTNIAYLPETPPILLTFIFVIICWFFSISKFRTINIVNVFLLFFVIIFGFFVAIANFQYKNYSLLLPFLENGYAPVIKGIKYQASGMVELFFFLLLQHKIKEPLRFRHFFITILILTGLTIGPLMGSIVEFGPTEATRQRFPPYEQWGLVSIGRFIEHVDFLSIYQWLSGVFIRISLLFFIIGEITPMNDGRKKTITLFIFSLIVGIIVLVPISDFKFNDMLRSFILPFSGWFFLSLSLILFILTRINIKKKRVGTNEI